MRLSSIVSIIRLYTLEQCKYNLCTLHALDFLYQLDKTQGGVISRSITEAKCCDTVELEVACIHYANHWIITPQCKICDPSLANESIPLWYNVLFDLPIPGSGF